MEVALIVLSSVLGLSFAGMVIVTKLAHDVMRKSVDENRAALNDAMANLRSAIKESQDRLQIGQIDNGDRLKAVMVEALDRVQSRSLIEAMEVAHLRAQSDATVSVLKDELAKSPKKKTNGASGPRKFTDVLGNTYGEDELEAL